MQAMEELGHFQLPRTRTFSASKNCVQILAARGRAFITLKHKVMAADEWGDNWSQDLVKVSLCIQIAIDKMQLFIIRRLCQPIP
jgi:hypothetical protein